MLPLTHDEYERGRYFLALDGLRAVSVLMVILHHMTEKRVWYWLNGYAGVTAFFVLSGFLITTLCIREMDRSGPDRRLSLSGFYIKRLFRIVPLYLVALAAYGVLTLGWDLTGSWSQFVEKLPYYATLNGDLVTGEPFAISWSLGVEEKFYIFWPLVLVATRLFSRGGLVVMGIGLVAVDVASQQFWTYPEMYLAILVGCTLAFALNHRGWYGVARRIASLPGAGLCIAASVVITWASLPHYDGGVPSWPASGALSHLFVPAVAVLIGYVAIRPSGAMARALSTSPARWIGERSYAIYLFHAMTIHLVDTFLEHEYDALRVALRVAVVLAITLAVADVLHRFVEKPCRQVGRRIVHAREQAGLPAGSPVESETTAQSRAPRPG